MVFCDRSKWVTQKQHGQGSKFIKHVDASLASFYPTPFFLGPLPPQPISPPSWSFTPSATSITTNGINNGFHHKLILGYLINKAPKGFLFHIQIDVFFWMIEMVTAMIKSELTVFDVLMSTEIAWKDRNADIPLCRERL